MSTTGISFSGLASGLDTQAIIQALLAVERRPIAQFEQKKSLLGSQKNLFGDVEQMLEDLVDKAKDIRLASSFLDFAVATDKEEFLTASASSDAAAGSYEIEVVQLAKAQVNASAGKADKDVTTYGTGTLLFTVGGQTHAVEVGQDSTLEGIAAAVNAANDLDDIGVRAQVIDTGDPNDPFQLVFSATEPGADHGFSVTTDVAGGALRTLIQDIEGQVVTAARNAIVKVDGIAIQRSSNQVADVIQGVTLDLVGENSTGQVTRLTVSPDAESTSGKIKAFVDKYNEIVDFLESQSKVDEEGNASSPLFGDATLRSIRSNLRSIVSSVVDTGNTAYSMLAQIGIDSDRAGRLTFNQSEFEAALAEDERAVEKLFTDPTSGIASRIYSELDVFTDSIDGLIKVRKEGIDRITKSIDDNIRRAEDRLEQYELGLVTRFSNLEVLMNRLQGQGSAVGAIGSAGFGTR